MGTKMSNRKVDINQFKEEICSKCRSANVCVNKDDNWRKSCPKYFNWSIGWKCPFADEDNPVFEIPAEKRLTKEKRAAIQKETRAKAKARKEKMSEE